MEIVSPTFRSLLLSLPSRLTTRLSSNANVLSLSFAVTTNVFFSASIDLILPPAVVFAAVAGPANKAIAIVAPIHFERHIIMKLPVWNLVAHGPLTEREGVHRIIRPNKDRSCFRRLVALSPTAINEKSRRGRTL